MYSVVLIVPTAYHEQAEEVSKIMGYGSPAYTVPLSNKDSSIVTHMGLHTWANQEFVDFLTSTTVPTHLAEAGYDEKSYSSLKSVLVASVKQDMENNFNDTLKTHNLCLADIKTYD